MPQDSWYGFDLGHGETAVSLSGSSARVEARNLQLVRGGAQVIPTVVALGPGGETLIGDAALLNSDATELRAAFKHPDVTRADVREPVIRFVRGVMDEMARSGSKIDGRLVFGHPSGWMKAEVDGYRELLAEASGQRPLMVPEARAAFLPLKSTGELSAVEIDAGRIVIADMGSSTTDFAVVRGVSDPLDLGNPGGVQLGAGLIELALFQQSLGDLPPTERQRLTAFVSGSARISERAEIVLHFRRAKEEFFRTEAHIRSSGRAPKVDLELLKDQLAMDWSPRITAELMDRCLNEPLDRLGVSEDLFGRPVSVKRSWRNEFFAHLDFALARLSEPPTTIVLTGGAAKMGWVFDEVKARHSSARVLRSAQPEHTIANGLALHGSALAKSSAIRDEITAFVKSDEVEKIIEATWDDGAERLVEPLVNGFVDDFVVPSVLAWRRGELASLEDIGLHGGRLAREWATSEEGTRALGEAGAVWYHDCVAPGVNKRVREICDKYPDIPSHAVEIPPDIFRNVDIDTSSSGNRISPDALLGSIDSALDGVILVVSSVVAAVLFGGGGAVLLPTGPGFVIVAAIIAAVTLIVGKDAALTWFKSAKIPVLARKALKEDFLSRQVTNKRESIETELRADMVKALRESTEARGRVAHEVGTLIDDTLSKRVRDASAHLI